MRHHVGSTCDGDVDAVAARTMSGDTPVHPAVPVFGSGQDTTWGGKFPPVWATGGHQCFGYDIGSEGNWDRGALLAKQNCIFIHQLQLVTVHPSVWGLSFLSQQLAGGSALAPHRWSPGQLSPLRPCPCYCRGLTFPLYVSTPSNQQSCAAGSSQWMSGTQRTGCCWETRRLQGKQRCRWTM